MRCYTAKTLGIGEETDLLSVEGSCDLLVIGLTEGVIQIEALFPGESAPMALPQGLVEEDSMSTFYVGEHGVQCKVVGVGNNAGVYVRLARPTRRG